MNKKISNEQAIELVKGIMEEDMVYISPTGKYYRADVYTRVIPEGTDEDTMHDYVMQELDVILDYFYFTWERKFEMEHGPYELYAEAIRDFVVDNIFVKFHSVEEVQKG